MLQKIRCRDFSDMHSYNPWVIIVPTYAWRIPRIVQEWLEKTSLAGNKNIYFAMTCGGSALRNLLLPKCRKADFQGLSALAGENRPFFLTCSPLLYNNTNQSPIAVINYFLNGFLELKLAFIG